MHYTVKLIVFVILIFTFSFAVWSPDLNALDLPTYQTISKSGIINYAFWVGMKLGLIAREKNIYSIKLPLINLGKNSFSNSQFLQLSYSNSFIKGLHTVGITVIASQVEKNDFLIKNMDYDFLSGNYTKSDLKARTDQYKRIKVEVFKDLDSTIDAYITKIYLRSVKKLKLTTLPYKKVKVIGNINFSWSNEDAAKTMTISSIPVKCNTLFIIGNSNVKLQNYENVFRIFQYNNKMESIIKGIVLGNLLDQFSF